MWAIVNVSFEGEALMRVKTTAELGALIRERRRQIGMDQKTLAAKAGVSRFWVIDIESGKPRAEVGLVLRALHALGLSIDVDVPPPAGSTRARKGGRPGAKLPGVDLAALLGSLAQPKTR